ncbi:LysR family transcriptional regulator [Pseudoalteromonas rubra]|uniref:LysR family transcriptional regulator n=1 Tax=Pseudoalteromonas rubra TaxID=43658 RepID=UPI000F779837|nr:LysR family transcriptional regulator [Pseudoalteromonas rubra]
MKDPLFYQIPDKFKVYLVPHRYQVGIDDSKMEIIELTRFVEIANAKTLQSAAANLHTTPGALSKSLKKLESSLGILLFDRVGKQLFLNENGKRLLPEALKILDLKDNVKAMLTPTTPVFNCRVSAPAILQYRWVGSIGAKACDIQIEYETDFELTALEKVKRGLVDIALTTQLIRSRLNEDLEMVTIGELTLKLAVGKTHPLAGKHSVTSAELANYPFAVPNTSPFCGELRGFSCDGWPHSNLKREIKWIVNDYAALCELVKCGLAVAFLPDYMIEAWQLTQLEVDSNLKNDTEQVCLIYRQHAPAWIKALAEEVKLIS